MDEPALGVVLVALQQAGHALLAVHLNDSIIFLVGDKSIINFFFNRFLTVLMHNLTNMAKIRTL